MPGTISSSGAMALTQPEYFVCTNKGSEAFSSLWLLGEGEGRDFVWTGSDRSLTLNPAKDCSRLGANYGLVRGELGVAYI